jgi:hypothetical protein
MSLRLTEPIQSSMPVVALPQVKGYRAKGVASPKMLPADAHAVMMPSPGGGHHEDEDDTCQAQGIKRLPDGSVSGARQLTRAGSPLGPRRIGGSARNPVVDVLISLRTTGQRWLDALKNSRIKPHSNFSSSFRLATQDDIPCDSFTHRRGECGPGANKVCNG